MSRRVKRYRVECRNDRHAKKYTPIKGEYRERLEAVGVARKTARDSKHMRARVVEVTREIVRVFK